MAATADQINTAKSTMNYFYMNLKGGANDVVKALYLATKAGTPSGMVAAIKAANTLVKNKKDEVKDAKTALEEVTNTDLADLKIKLTEAQGKVGELLTKIAAAKTKIGTAGKAEVEAAEAKAKEAQGKLDSVNPNVIKTKKGAELKAAIDDAKTAIDDAKTAIDDGTNGAEAKLSAASTAITGTTPPGTPPPELTAAITAAGEAKTAIGDDSNTLGKTAKTALTDYATYKTAQDAVDGINAAQNILDVAKAYNEGCGNKLNADLAQVKDIEVEGCTVKIIEKFGLLGAILKNIPYQATGVLANDGSSTFYNFEFPLSVDNLNIAKIYTKISGAVAGTGPFVGAASGGDIPEPEAQHTPHSTTHHVSKSLEQFNKFSYFVLNKGNCGSNKLDTDKKIKEDCYKEIAKDVSGLYPGVDITTTPATDETNMDVSGEYQYAKMFEGTELSSPNVEL